MLATSWAGGAIWHKGRAPVGGGDPARGGPRGPEIMKFWKNSILRSLLIRPQESAGLVNTRKRDFGDVLKKLWF